MPGVSRVDQDTSNDQKIVEGCLTVFVNGLPMAVQGSVTAGGVNVVAGSTKVSAENRQVAREGDSMSDGNTIAQGSGDVWCEEP